MFYVIDSTDNLLDVLNAGSLDEAERTAGDMFERTQFQVLTRSEYFEAAAETIGPR